jgi:phage terminase small subunit
MTTKRVRNPFSTPQQGTLNPRPGVNGSPINVSPNQANGLLPLTPQMQTFVDNYLANGFKAVDAAEKAGYNRSYGAQLLQRPNIQQAIQKEIQRRKRRSEITQDRILEELAVVAFGNVADFFEDFGKGRSLVIKPKADLSEEQQRLMASISETWRGNNRTLKFRAHDKLRALTLLCQHLGMLDGTGKAVDPEGMVARLRAAAGKATDSMPQPVTGDSTTDYDDSEEEAAYDDDED